MCCSSRSSPEAAAVGLHRDGQSVTDGVVLVATIRFWSAAVHTIACRWPSMAVLVKTRPKPLIEGRQLNQRVMGRELMTSEALCELRLHGLEDATIVERATASPSE
jgi:uncharacterized membrane protein YcaP (DUF421 family)